MHAIRYGLKDAVEAILTADCDVDQTDDVVQTAKVVDKVVNQTDKVRQSALISCMRTLN